MEMSNRFARDEWNLGIVDQTVQDIVRHGIQRPIVWFPGSSWRIFADPFCTIRPDGSILIVAERLNHWICKGEIWGAVVHSGDDPSKVRFKPFATGGFACAHLSYPFFIQDGSTQYVTMESYEAGALYLWRRDGQQWRYERTLLERPAIDATIYRGDRYWWLFCTFADDGADERLHLFYSESLLGDWISHPMNPVKSDRANARPAGALFLVDGKLIRPAQDSSVTYGGKLVLNHVLALSTEVFKEVPCRTITPQSEYYTDGIHTIAGAGTYTVIDGKHWHHGLGSIASRITAKAFKIYRRRGTNRVLSRVQFMEGFGTPPE
jgi:hypothetical protein